MIGLRNDDSSGLQLVAPTSGDVLTTWTNGVPSLIDINGMTYERRSNSLIVSGLRGFTSPVVRLEADHGALVQEYAVESRLSACKSFASFVAPSGNLYTLLRCGPNPNTVWTTTYLYGMTQAGQLLSEVLVRGWGWLQLQLTLVVCEDKRMFYLVTRLRYPNPLAMNYVMAFSMNGTSVWNATDARIGNIEDWSGSLLRFNDNTLALIASPRIALLDLDNGAWFSNITTNTTNNTRLLAAAYDGSTWYCSEVTGVTFPGACSLSTSTLRTAACWHST